MLKCAAGLLALGLCTLAASAQTITGKPQIVDGDTIIIGTEAIRLHGIDAPEAGQMCAAMRCGRVAISALAEIAEGKHVLCEGRERDAHGRLVAKCRVGKIDVGAELVRRGMAWAFVKYSDDYLLAETEARNRRMGIWAQQQPLQSPWEYRAQRWRASAQEAPEGCPIKGNITQQGEKIYHAPWSPWYSKTMINIRKGERWFCDERSAVEAGWRAPLWR